LNRACPDTQDRSLEFQKCGQLFIGAHDETLPVAAMRVNEDCAGPLKQFAAET
jgi:hypothetical protein